MRFDLSPMCARSVDPYKSAIKGQKWEIKQTLHYNRESSVCSATVPETKPETSCSKEIQSSQISKKRKLSFLVQHV